jgi:hypothetical protein
VYRIVFAPALAQRNAERMRAVEKHLDELQVLVAVRGLADLDQTRLRSLSEALAGELQAAGPEIGLASPSLGD